MPVKLKPTQLVKWNKKDEPLIERYLKEVLDILDITADGSVETSKGFSLMLFRKILVQNIELLGIDALDVREGLVYKTVFRLKKLKEQNIHGFRKSLASEVKKYLNRPIEKYTILFLLHASSNNLPSIKQIKILGVQLQFSNWEYVRKNFEFPKFLKEADIYLRRQNGVIDIESRFIPILVNVESRNGREGFDKASPSFDLMRAIFTLYHHYGVYNEQWGGYPRPLAKVLPPPVYCVFRETGEFEFLLNSVLKIEEFQRNTISAQEIKYLRKLSSNFKVVPKETETLSLIVEALQKYSQAHETNEWRLAFLLLWQILELITLQTSEQFTMKNVISRVGILLRHDPQAADLLSALYDTRNKFVHQGNFPNEQGLQEVSLIKNIAERAINQVFSRAKKFPTKSSLQRFFDNAGINDTELLDRQRVIGMILRERKNNK
ncbi:MAG: HEPN domain-containing protein [Anaerolineales bacterium]